ncbi:MAG: hypothetical protein RLZZ76_209 [Candidatus Parcubacteria bacterium]|jgi:hypothetical protein
MIDKKTIISLLSKLTHGQKKVIAKQTIHPRREWFIGLLLFIAITFLGGVFSLYSFTRYSDIHLTLRATEQAVESYKEQTVKKALSMFGEKKKKFEALESEGKVVVTSTIEEVKKEENVVPEVTQTGTSSEVNADPTDVVSEPAEETVGTTTPVLEVF